MAEAEAQFLEIDDSFDVDHSRTPDDLATIGRNAESATPVPRPVSQTPTNRATAPHHAAGFDATTVEERRDGAGAFWADVVRESGAAAALRTAARSTSRSRRRADRSAAPPATVRTTTAST
ncbi:hypothetical protein O3Q52_04875 [Streptomyces sp. ActVer]|uniref:hypothetical protein n=1 Tax=Streptomyces sp. ActVer TaxID=3014558 RepID=UPI0022B582E4|nr:hypothetical protein [Streptomyces sp. ActVer]MCZ4507553.1 hypothetical protein [Streptomyces sp. ActVer]